VAPILAVVFPSMWKRTRSLVFFSGKDNNDSPSEIILFYVLGYLRFDYKRCLTCLEVLLLMVGIHLGCILMEGNWVIID
jgi:hypothetical protein